jgi:hypothetical protein
LAEEARVEEFALGDSTSSRLDVVLAKAISNCDWKRNYHKANSQHWFQDGPIEKYNGRVLTQMFSERRLEPVRGCARQAAEVV